MTDLINALVELERRPAQVSAQIDAINININHVIKMAKIAGFFAFVLIIGIIILLIGVLVRINQHENELQEDKKNF